MLNLGPKNSKLAHGMQNALFGRAAGAGKEPGNNVPPPPVGAPAGSGEQQIQPPHAGPPGSAAPNTPQCRPPGTPQMQMPPGFPGNLPPGTITISTIFNLPKNMNELHESTFAIEYNSSATILHKRSTYMPICTF